MEYYDEGYGKEAGGGFGTPGKEDFKEFKDQDTATNSLVEFATKSLIEYRRSKESLHQEMNLMKQTILTRNEETINSTTPSIVALHRDLNTGIASQKDENAKIQSQITELKKEKSQMQQLIKICVQKVQELEEQVGSYK